MSFTQRSLYHGWLPRYPAIHRKFLEVHVLGALNSPLAAHKEPVQKFANAINGSKEMSDLFASIFDQVNKETKWEASSPDYRVRDFNHLLDVLDTIVDAPPKFYKVKNDQGETIGEPIGVPILLVFDLLSNTGAAYDLFRRKDFNKAMKDLLQSWGTYLMQDGSNTTLTKQDWYSDAAMAVLQAGLGQWSFDQTYVVDPNAGDFRYKSWDHFFTRELKATGPDGKPLRPITGEGLLPLIYNACESTVLRTATNVKLNDTFWLKSQKYSLFDMLGGREYPEISQHAKDFEGASVYQAFLSPQDYHRWHSPIKGKITASKLLEGTYYAVQPDAGAPEGDTDLQPGDPHGALIRSQAWLSVVATRAVYIIEPAEPQRVNIKKLCFIAIGMAEVSTCDITVKSGDVNAGDEIGMFHFGGSSHTLIIQPADNHEILFQDDHDTPIRPGQHRWINSTIAHIQQKRG